MLLPKQESCAARLVYPLNLPNSVPHSSPHPGACSFAFIYMHCSTLLSTHVVVTLPCELHGHFCQYTPTRTHPHTHNSTSTQTWVNLSCAFNNTPKWFSAVRQNPSSSWPESYILFKVSRLPNGALYTGAQWAQGRGGSGSCYVVLCDPSQTFPWVLRSSGGIIVLY